MINLKFFVFIIVIGFGVQIQTNYAQTADEFIERAQAAQNKGEYAEMVKNANEAVKLDSRSALAYFLRGVGYFMQNKNAEAVADSAKAIELNPQIAPIYFLHSGALIALRPADWKIAVTDLDKAIEFDPTYWEYFRERARIRNEYAKDFTNALTDADQSIKLNANDADAFFVRGGVYQSLNKLSEAESDFTQSIKLGKNTANIYNSRGVVCFLQNKKDAALADFRQALKIEPDNKKTQENIELALAKTSNTKAEPAASPSSSSNAEAIAQVFYKLNNNIYDIKMTEAEKLFKKLTTHHYSAPSQVTYMGRTEIVDAYAGDKNKLAGNINDALQAMRAILNNRDVTELSSEQRQFCQERLDKAVSLQTEAARRGLVTLVQK